MVEGADDMISQQDEHHEERSGSGHLMPAPPMEVKSQSDDPSIRAIKADIQRTETTISKTLEAIQEKLSLDKVLKQAEDKVMSLTIEGAKTMTNKMSHFAEDAGSSISETVRRNPIPTALLGLGLSWLLARSLMGSRDEASDYEVYGLSSGDYPEESEYAGVEELEFSGHESDEGEHGRARRMLDKLKGRTSGVQERAGEMASHMREEAKHLGGQVKHQAERTRSGMHHLVEDHALAVGLSAFAIGALIGLSIPESYKERKLMGESREKLARKTRELSHEAKEKVKKVVKRASHAARDEAEKQHLTSNEESSAKSEGWQRSKRESERGDRYM
jgi:hypothetical protein